MPEMTISEFWEENCNVDGFSGKALTEAGYPSVDVTELSSSQKDFAQRWCRENLGEEFLCNWYTFWFSNDDDAFKFKMYCC